ncbi:MAG: hypothetical protein U0637_13400 [Phycisphaerales bacterium]
MRRTAQTIKPSVPADRPAGRPAFTLLELLVTIGAVAVVAVGLAAVFGAVGNAVATGRRVSRMTQYSRMLEAQLRKDFGSMTREGFLVIRQQYADRNNSGVLEKPSATDVGDGVRLGEADLAPRPRRVDEVIFFGKGDFVTSRPSLPDPSWTARSDAAMVYYGHGERIDPNDGQAGDPYGEPKLDYAHIGNDPNYPGRAGGYNRFAGKWTLVRHATLLCPLPSVNSLPAAPMYGVPVNTAPGIQLLRDKDCQFRGQPAMSSIFRAINSAQGVGVPAASVVTNPGNLLTDYLWYADDTQTSNPLPGAVTQNFSGTTFRSPMLSSGLVDIATTSMEEVMQRLLGSGNAALPDGFDPAVPQTNPGTSTSTLATPAGLGRTGPAHEVDVAHAWMDNAFPAPTSTIDPAATGTPYPSANGSTIQQEVSPGSRIRCEERAVELLAAVGGVGTNPNQRRYGAYTRGDRLMLPMNSLAPACSEFQVDWTFGQMDANNQLVWHGLVPLTPPAGGADPNPRPYDDTDAGTRLFYDVPLIGLQYPGRYYVPERLIYGNDVPAGTTAAGGQIQALTSYFGQVDPVFNPDNTNTAPTNINGTRVIEFGPPSAAGNGSWGDAADSARVRVPWPWPTLIRVRVTLADPVDPKPETEQTFEYVFEVPTRNGT